MTGKDTVRIFSIAAGLIALLILGFGASSIVENVDAGEIVVIQDALDGELHVHTEPGLVMQSFGTVTTYQKSNQFWFEPKVKGDTDDGAIRRGCFRMRFNDQGTAEICGSATFDLPTDEKSVLALHDKFRSMEGVIQRLVKTGIDKSIYNTGPLMSSRESANEKRGKLIQYVIDQATIGVYQVEVIDEEVVDLEAEPVVTVVMVPEPKVGKDGTVELNEEGNPIMHSVPKKRIVSATKVVKASRPKFENGLPLVQEESALTASGIRLYNLTINAIAYDDRVKKQIDQQQEAIMSIQTAKAKTLSAQQAAITAKAEGLALEAKAKATERVKTAKLTEEAQRKVVVAEQAKKEADLKAAAVVVTAEANAKAKELLAEADGSLTQKLAAWTNAQKHWAAAAAKQAQVPQVVIGSGGSSTQGGATSSMQDLMTLALTQQLGLDMNIKKGHTKK